MLDGQTVYVVDDDQAVLESMRWLIESAGYTVAAFESPAAFLDRLPHTPRGCLVIDLRLQGVSGIEVIRAIRERAICLPSIVVTGHGDVSAAVRAMKAGAIDFVEKPFDDQALLERVRAALATGETQARRQEQVQSLQSLYAKLTPRERQVMKRVVNGDLNKQIAADLGLSHKTIEVHRAHVMDKMQAGSLADLVRKSIMLENDSST